MSVLVNKNTKLIVRVLQELKVHFILNKQLLMVRQYVGGVTPYKGGVPSGLPIFNTVVEAKQQKQMQRLFMFHLHLLQMLFLRLLMQKLNWRFVTEGIPVLDILELKKLMVQKQD